MFSNVQYFYLLVKRDLFSDFLETIEHRTTEDVLTYEWTAANNQNQSGTNVVYFMEHFLGYKDMMPLSHVCIKNIVL